MMLMMMTTEVLMVNRANNYDVRLVRQADGKLEMK